MAFDAIRDPRQLRETKMTVFTKHPHEQGVSYFEHLGFAIGIAGRLLTTVVAFTLHALFPFITIQRQFDLEATSAFLLERNRFIEAAAANPRFLNKPVRPTLSAGHDNPAAA